MAGLPSKVTLRVPATTANLGPAYDTLGMALSLYMTLTVEHADAFAFDMTGDGAEHVTRDAANLIVATCRRAHERVGVAMPPLRFTAHNTIPFGCGCGSSSAAAIAGYVAGMLLTGQTLSATPDEQLLSIIAAIEGHADNAAPALYGGIQLGYTIPSTPMTTTTTTTTTEGSGDGGDDDNDAADEPMCTRTQPVPTPPGLSVVLFVPHALMKASTHVTRGLLPTSVPRDDVVHNVSRTALLVLALTTGRLELLQQCSDRVHERYRANALYPHYVPCAAAARDAGAAYAFLSGAGPTVCAFVGGRRGEAQVQQTSEHDTVAVARAMVRAAAAVGVPGRAIITRPSDVGVHVVGTRRATREDGSGDDDDVLYVSC